MDNFTSGERPDEAIIHHYDKRWSLETPINTLFLSTIVAYIGTSK
jgi:hypothetical protein